MATATGTTARRPSPPRVVVILLALSLALNLCFLAGVVWVRMHRPLPFVNHAQRMEEIARQLDLDPQQRVAFNTYFTTMHARTQAMHEAVEPLIGDAWSEVAKPQADETQIMSLFDTAANKRRAFQRDATTQTLAFLATLNPQQRAEFVALARAHWAHREHRLHHPPH
jgi:uncharacterized membrane protein